MLPKYRRLGCGFFGSAITRLRLNRRTSGSSSARITSRIRAATGLRAALEMLRLSARNTLAIGDAENDHEMLRVAEVGAAVEWGSASLIEVRHREKYVDVPVTESRAFVFTENGHSARRARTLRQFVESVEHTSDASVAGYLQRGDFSRWIGDVFGDRALADDLKLYEDRYQIERTVDVVSDIANAIRSRYDLTVGDDTPHPFASPVGSRDTAS